MTKADCVSLQLFDNLIDRIEYATVLNRVDKMVNLKG